MSKARGFATKFSMTNLMKKYLSIFVLQYLKFFAKLKIAKINPIIKGDVILFKGSQNTIFLEGAVEMCLKNKSDAFKLCRREKFWEKKRMSLRV